jgi:lysophospholipase L1-like esterase
MDRNAAASLVNVWKCRITVQALHMLSRKTGSAGWRASFQSPWPPAKILELNGWIKEYAKRKAVVYLDYYYALLDDNHALKRNLSGDGLHPNAAGYAIMTPLAQRAIEQALAP